jgi:hypothetical protein
MVCHQIYQAFQRLSLLRVSSNFRLRAVITNMYAGGSGVSYTIAMLEDLIQQARKGTSACQRVVFIWSIRDEGMPSLTPI